MSIVGAAITLGPTLGAGQTIVQSVQYRSPEGVEYRSLPDTDAVKNARTALEANPRNIARIIDLGVAQSGARQFREAIATFTRGLEIEPNNALLLRWRGHRYLSVREFDRAFADLTRGAAIDGTIYGIWYHLGIVQYLRGNFADAAASFAKAQPIAPDAGELAGSTDWLWMSLSRAGRGAEAKAMLDRRPDSKPVTNAYTRRLQLYRGEIGPDAVVTPADTDDVQVATLAYGLGNWYLLRGDSAQARRWFERSIQSGGWPGFGFIVSEVELRRGAAAERPPGADWPATNYSQTANRYSPLTEINAKNVGALERVWSVHLKPADFVGPMREDEAVPIVIGNTMYVASPYGAVIALDAATGAEKWKFQLPNNELPSKRGVAYWPGGGNIPLPASIVFGSTTGKLYSLKAADGTLNEWFGENGVITLKTAEVMQTGMDAPYSLLSSATIYRDLIITGAGTGEGPGGSNGGAGPAGDTRAWDARSGKLVWTFHSVPRPGEFGYDTWGGDSAKNRSGVNVWGYTSLDAERGILYMPLGAPNNDRVGIDRPGNNLFSSSIVAVDANTGKYLWHFQLVHHDIWDYDTESAPLLVDLHRNGQIVPAVIIVNKTGLLFTLNRVTGKPIFDIEERPVPKSEVPGEQASPTQPFPAKPEPLTQNTIARNNLYKGEPQHQSYCEHLVDDNHMKLGGPYMPIAFNQYSISPPGPAGGINFWGASYDPELHLFVSNTSNIFQPMRIVQRPDGSYANSGPLAGTRRFGDPDRKLLCGPTPWGELVAVNMDTGDIVYRKTLGVSDALPAGLQDTGRPSSGGVILTASGLTFVGGTDDFRFRAFATATGEKLWEIKLPSSIETTPITYLGNDGRQFVAVVSTGGGLTGSQVTNDEVIAFALAKK